MTIRVAYAFGRRIGPGLPQCSKYIKEKAHPIIMSLIVHSLGLACTSSCAKNGDENSFDSSFPNLCLISAEG
jgi:hypothetical protein